MKELSNQTTAGVSIILNRSIFFFYEKSLRYVPVFLMLCHMYGVYSFMTIHVRYLSTFVRTKSV